MTGYIRGLDGLRAVALLSVMFGHVFVASKIEVSTIFGNVDREIYDELVERVERIYQTPVTHLLEP